MVNTCWNRKKHFDTEDAARTRLDEIHRNPDPWRDHHPCRVIQCDWCGSFVLTSKTRPDEDLVEVAPEPEPESEAPTKKLVRRKPTQRGRRTWSGGGRTTKF